ncbi:MAG: hypothetical protein PHE27_00305 [Alphaproteobacteria bacterium]|nr:hypothetical protein [Alphaproteobacteria bacterium]
MRYRLVSVSLACAILVAACSSTKTGEPSAVQFWRPISEPNILMATDVLQQKLEFDLSQCHCGIYPANATRDNAIKFQTDKQRLAQTGVTITPNEEGNCRQQPSLVVTECMRHRGWEPTQCSGRMPLPSGGSLCAKYTPPTIVED